MLQRHAATSRRQAARSCFAAPLPARRRAGFRRAAALFAAALADHRAELRRQPPSINALIGNALAVAIAFWMRLSIETYPGIRVELCDLPGRAGRPRRWSSLLLLTRLPYRPPRPGAGLRAARAVELCALFLCRSGGSASASRSFRSARSTALTEIDSVDWRRFSDPRLDEAAGCHAIVADFAADLPDEWEAFLADAALAGRIVYQVKQLSESLTGRVELDHLSENSFGSLLPARGYFHLKASGRFPGRGRAAARGLAGHGGWSRSPSALDDGGPILFRQARIGHAGKRITVYKFRTMRPVADSMTTTAQRGDDRRRRRPDHPASAHSCAAAGSTSCRRSSTSCKWRDELDRPAAGGRSAVASGTPANCPSTATAMS